MAASAGDFADGYATALTTWRDAGLTVLAIADTPWPGVTAGRVPHCLVEHPGDHSACSAPRSVWVPGDPVVDAVQAIGDPDVKAVDLNDHLCGPETCQPIVGGVVVYADNSHLTTTYARTLTPYLDDALTRALENTRQDR